MLFGESFYVYDYRVERLGSSSFFYFTNAVNSLAHCAVQLFRFNFIL
jgi:hypothetical protein